MGCFQLKLAKLQESLYLLTRNDAAYQNSYVIAFLSVKFLYQIRYTLFHLNNIF